MDMITPGAQTGPTDNSVLDLPSVAKSQPNIERVLDLMSMQESSNNPNAKGKKGEIGMLQIMPATAAQYGVSPEALTNPHVNRGVAKQYLSDLLTKYNGHLGLALAAYNAGPGHVDKGFIPDSTKNYVSKILGQLGAQPAGAAEGPELPSPAPSTGKGVLQTPDKYSSYEEYANAWKNTKSYLKLPQSARIASFDKIRGRWEENQQAQQQAQQNAPDITGRASNAIASGIGNAVNAVDPSGDLAGPIQSGIKYILPGTNAQAGIDAALFALGGPEIKGIGSLIDVLPEAAQPAARLAVRLGLPAVGGAAGGATEGQKGAGEVIQGAEQGVEQAALGEGASYALGIGRRAVQRMDIKSIGEYLGPKIGAKISSIGDIDREFIGNNAIARAEANMSKVNSDTARTLGPKMSRSQQGTVTVNVSTDMAKHLKLPMVGPYQLTLKEANELLDASEKIGWDPRFRASNGHAAASMRSSVHQAEQDVAKSILKTNPKAGMRWYKAREKLRTARALSNLFQEPGVIVDKDLDMAKLQKLITDGGPNGYKVDLEQSIGPKAHEELANSVFRGGEAIGTKSDIHGRGIIDKNRIYLHLGFIPSARGQIPRLTRHAGHIPYNLGEGRALTAMKVLGPTVMAHKLSNIFSGGDVSAQQTTP